MDTKNNPADAGCISCTPATSRSPHDAFLDDLADLVVRHAAADLPPITQMLVNALRDNVIAHRPDAFEGPARASAPVQVRPAPPVRVTLNRAEREAIAEDLGYTRPGDGADLYDYDELRHELVPKILLACRRHAQLALDEPGDVTFNDPEILGWLAALVWQVTLENVADSSSHGTPEYWATWTCLEGKFGIDRRALDPDTADRLLKEHTARRDVEGADLMFDVAVWADTWCGVPATIPTREGGA